MSVTYKDIDQLSQKSTVAGTEKIPVSDTEYITPEQIADLSSGVSILAISGVSVDSTTISCDLAFSDADGNCLVAFREGHILTKYFDSAALLQEIGDIETLLAAL